MSNQLPPSNAPLGNGGNTGDEKEAGQTVEESEKSAHQNAEQAIGGNEDDTDPQEEQTEGITTLNENDVLLGRGRGPSTFIGNKKFSDLVMEYKSRYKATNKFNEKMVIAHTIYEEILDRGGRFLELTSKTDSKLVVKHGVWRVASWDVALERCKQSLREKILTKEEKAEQARKKQERKLQARRQELYGDEGPDEVVQRALYEPKKRPRMEQQPMHMYPPPPPYGSPPYHYNYPPPMYPFPMQQHGMIMQQQAMMGPPNATPSTRSAFMCFSDAKQEEFRGTAKTTKTKERFRRVAEAWSKLTPEERAFWEEEAKKPPPRRKPCKKQPKKPAVSGPSFLPTVSNEENKAISGLFSLAGKDV